MIYTPASLDTGFGYTEALTMVKNFKTQSVAGEPIQLLNSNLGSEIKGIVSEVNGRELFVGDLAINQSPARYFSLKENKPNDAITKFIGLTALSQALAEDDERVRLVTALPVNHYFSMKEEAEQMFLGQHKVTVNGRIKEFEVECCRTTVQGLEAAFDQLLDEEGNIVAPWAMQPFAGVDIGFYTTNLFAVDKLQPIRKLCKSIPVGVASAWKLLTDFIYREKGIELNLYEVDEIVKTNVIHAQGAEWDISSAVRRSLESVATEINGQVETLWSQRPFVKILGIGGGMLRMGMRILPGELVPVKDPQGANARGGLKLARREATWKVG